MTWRWIGNKPSSEPMLTRLADAYMQQAELMLDKCFIDENTLVICDDTTSVM